MALKKKIGWLKDDTETPIKVMIGTCPGGKKDTEAMARTQIDRYFDLPSHSWMYVRKARKGGYFYEVHEGGAGRPYLPSVLAFLKKDELMEDDDADIDETDESYQSVIIKPLSERAVEVIMKANGNISTLSLPEKDSESLATTEGLVPAKGKKMKPYATTGSEWITIGVASMSLGLLMMSVAGALNKTADLVVNGYYEMASSLPTTRLMDLSGIEWDTVSVMKSHEELPSAQWNDIFQARLAPGESISRFEYVDGRWNIVKAGPDESGLDAGPDVQDLDTREEEDAA